MSKACSLGVVTATALYTYLPTHMAQRGLGVCRSGLRLSGPGLATLPPSTVP